MDYGFWIDLALDIVSAGFVITGAVFVLAGAIGVIRLPDFYTRMHAAGVTDTLGAEMIVIGCLEGMGCNHSVKSI